MKLDEFNSLDEVAARQVVAVWADIPSWVDGVVTARPYPTVDDLYDTSRALADTWTAADVDRALGHHPRIGDKPTGSGAGAAASRSEQRAVATADDTVVAELAEGNREYERRFGRIFLIRAAGRSPEEILTELTRRLGNDPITEAVEVVGQLREIALHRLRGTVRGEEG